MNYQPSDTSNDVLVFDFNAPPQDGPVNFGNASVDLPIGVPTLDAISLLTNRSVVPDATVTWYTVSSKAITAAAVYDFKQAQVNSVSISGTTANIGFSATDYSWTIGSDTAQYTTPVDAGAP